MHGNTWEWFFDWFNDEYYKKCKENGIIENPVNTENGSFSVIRCGSWLYGAGHCSIKYLEKNVTGVFIL